MLQHADPENETVTITRPMFDRLEEQRKTVAEDEHRLNQSAEAHKYAKKRFDASRDTLDALVSEMIRVVNGGPSDLPLFDNMTDRLDEAQMDPVSQDLLKRLVDHGYTNLNLLIVHGYTQEERGQLTAYLDSLDARDKFSAMQMDGWDVDVPEALPEPAFIAPEAVAQRQAEQNADAPTNDQIDEALQENGLQFMPTHAHMNAQQRCEVMAWAQACATVREEKRENLTFDDLPAAPTYVLNPAELLPPAELTVEPVDDDTPTEQPTKPRAKRRSSATFKNTVGDQLKAKKTKKGKK